MKPRVHSTLMPQVCGKPILDFPRCARVVDYDDPYAPHRRRVAGPFFSWEIAVGTALRIVEARR